MSYESVDTLQKVLMTEVFHYAKDSKKAAGRALGTIVEIITYYLIKTWGLNNQISIEKGLEEYGNPDITHNVEFSLHPIIHSSTITITKTDGNITSTKLFNFLKSTGYDLAGFTKKPYDLIKNGVLRNACTIGTSESAFLLCSIEKDLGDRAEVNIYKQSRKPYSVFECKRVGVEEGMNKGPQTIEKAKQGAYVARTASSLKKIRNEYGEMNGIIYKSDGTYVIKPFVELMEDVIFSNDKELLRKFILTVGVVSNHGNWFTAENQNKELKVLAQSYDWLIFLTDKGLSEFIKNLLLNPFPGYESIRESFLSSYTLDKKKNQFTKVQMNAYADKLLLEYFKKNLPLIESWFNIITPKGKSLKDLQEEMSALKEKDWINILL